MARYAVVSNGVVANIIELDADADWSPPEGSQKILATPSCGIGWSYDGTSFVDPNPPAPPTIFIPQSITSTQLIRWLDSVGKLDTANAIVAQADSLTKALWVAASTYSRQDPLLIKMATLMGMSSADIDNAFIAASKL
jgi:hypothetical protein